jgi:hypothetical protein
LVNGRLIPGPPKTKAGRHIITLLAVAAVARAAHRHRWKSPSRTYGGWALHLVGGPGAGTATKVVRDWLERAAQAGAGDLDYSAVLATITGDGIPTPA